MQKVNQPKSVTCLIFIQRIAYCYLLICSAFKVVGGPWPMPEGCAIWAAGGCWLEVAADGVVVTAIEKRKIYFHA